MIRWNELGASEIQGECDKFIEQAVTNSEEAGYKRSVVKVIGALPKSYVIFKALNIKANRLFQSGRGIGCKTSMPLPRCPARWCGTTITPHGVVAHCASRHEELRSMVKCAVGWMALSAFRSC